MVRHGRSEPGSFSQRSEALELHPRGRGGEFCTAKCLGAHSSTRNEVGLKLFEQLGKKIALTEAGLSLIPYARRVMAAVEDARQCIQELQGLERGSLRIGASTTQVGQPISHRIDHLLSGTRAQIAIKLFGPDLATLRAKAGEIREAMEGVDGIVDLLVEPQVGVPQVQVNMNRQAAAAVGLRAEHLADTVDGAFNGHIVSQVLDEQRPTTCWCASTTRRDSPLNQSQERL
jgi:Cu/Ag efflux pump CusA